MFDASDTLLTTRSFPTLGVLDTVPGSFAVTLSTVGTYNIIAVADHSGLIVESDAIGIRRTLSMSRCTRNSSRTSRIGWFRYGEQRRRLVHGHQFNASWRT